MSVDAGLTIEELAAEVGVPVRTIRYYIAEGLLPGPGTRGKGASYGEEHLLRLRLIRLLAEQRMPLAEIRQRVAGLSLEDVRALLAQEQAHATILQRVEEQQSAQSYVAALLERARAARAQPPVPRMPEAEASRAPLADGPAIRLPEAWERITLAPGVELHVRSDARRAQRSLIGRLLRAAGQGGYDLEP